MKVLYLNTEDSDATRIIKHIEGSQEEIKRLLKCEQIRQQPQQIGKKIYNIICGDGDKVTAIDKDDNPLFKGNLIICSQDEAGNNAGLIEDDIDEFIPRIKTLWDDTGAEDPKSWHAIKAY